MGKLDRCEQGKHTLKMPDIVKTLAYFTVILLLITDTKAL
jgi:hypothetical protein